MPSDLSFASAMTGEKAAREKLPLDAQISGPAILEQMDTTILIEPQDSAVSDEDGNILVTVGSK